MKTHLSPDELVAAVDGSLEPTRAVHLDGCADCRGGVAELRAVIGDLERDDVPEPSPLFWEHFSARVRAATRTAPTPVASRWTSIMAWPALGGLAAALILVLVWWAGSRDVGSGVRAPGSAVPAQSAEAEPSWQVMADMAAGMTADDVRHATASMPEAMGTIGDLSADERRTFVELLKLEIGEPQ